jgi:hypothetical protein
VQAQEQYKGVIDKIKAHNSRWPNPQNPGEVADYNAEANWLNTWKAQLEGQLDNWSSEYAPSSSQAMYGDDITRGWTQPAPETPQSPHPVDHGPGTWGPVTESMSDRAAAYQEYITGHPITEGYKLPGYNVKFDGYENGYAIEAKSYYAQFIEDGHWKSFFIESGKAQKIVDQALNQVAAATANGLRVRWVFAESVTKAVVEQMFNGNPLLKGMIEYVVIPP